MECPPNPDCPFFNSDRGCEQDKHHLWYPKREYKTGLEKRFRNLSCNVINMCMYQHQQLHLTEQPPVKPDIEVMRKVINEHRR